MFEKIISFLRAGYLALYEEVNNNVEDVVVTVTYSDGTQREFTATRNGLCELRDGAVPQPIPFEGYM